MPSGSRMNSRSAALSGRGRPAASTRSHVIADGSPADRVSSGQPESSLVKQSTKTTLPEPQYHDEDRVAVTINYGAGGVSQGFGVGTTRINEDGKSAATTIWFGGDRIARNVPYYQAKAIQRLYQHGVCRIHPNEATETEIARACGVRPGDPSKLARQLLLLLDGQRLEELTGALSSEELSTLAEGLAQEALKVARAREHAREQGA
jgi:hypothetical protein